MPDVKEVVCPPAWRRAIMAAQQSVPFSELKAQIRAEAEALPELLHANGGGDQERDALLSLKVKCGRVLDAMPCGPFEPLAFVKPKKLRKRLIAEVADLPDALVNGGELERARKVYRVKVLCHRTLGLLLAIAFFGVCGFCEFVAQMPIEDPVEVAWQENNLAGDLPQG